MSTPQTVYVDHGRRTTEAIDGILGADFAGTIVADCYAAYDHFLTTKQRCWAFRGSSEARGAAEMARDLDEVLGAHGEEMETVAWVAGIRAVYEQASTPRPPSEEGWTPQAVRAREQRAQQCARLILLLCPADLDPHLPYATLAKRLRKYLAEHVTFVRDPAVPATNHAAERSLRPLVVTRKVSGGTRSLAGSADSGAGGSPLCSRDR